jgi:hypothetical protein
LGWLCGAYRLAINTLWGGFDVALMWLWVAFFGINAFYILRSASKVIPGECPVSLA